MTETAISSDIPFDQILRHADRHDANVIIMGAGEKSDDDPFRLGITAEKVLRKASKPVWMVKPDAVMQITNILCPVDCSEPSTRALANAIRLARSFQAELTVLHVIRPLTIILRLSQVGDMDEAIFVGERHSQFQGRFDRWFGETLGSHGSFPLLLELLRVDATASLGNPLGMEAY